MVDVKENLDEKNIRQTFFVKIKRSLNKFIVDSYSSRQSWGGPATIILIGLIYFYIAFRVILWINPAYNGDVAINGIIINDYRNGTFVNWYFYGQYYFGNLWNAIVALLSLPTGLSFDVMAFWELATFSSALILIALRIKWLHPLLSVFFYPIFLFINPFYSFYYSQGFSPIVLIIALFFFYYDSAWIKEKIPGNFLWFFTGLWGGLSLWHYPAYIIIFPVFGLLTLGQRFLKQLNWKWISIVYGFFGYCFGLIPLILAGFASNWNNLRWFVGDGSGKRESYSDSLLYYIQEFAFYFSFNKGTPYPQGELNFEIIREWVLLDMRNLSSLVLFLISVAVLIFSLIQWKKYLIHLAFIFFFLIILVLRGTDQASSVFSLVRYSMAWHVLWIGLAIRVLNENIDYTSIRGKLFSTITTVFFGITTLFVITNLAVYHRSAYPYDHTYEIIHKDLVDLGVEYLYCYNDFEFCGQVAFLAQSNNSGITIQFNDLSPNPYHNRNPLTRGKVDRAVLEGKKVFSFVPQFLVWSVRDKTSPIKEYAYGANVYGLVDIPVFCSVDGVPEGVNPESGMYLRTCSIVSQEYQLYLQTQQAVPAQ